MAVIFEVQNATRTAGGINSIAPRAVRLMQAMSYDVLAKEDGGAPVTDPSLFSEQDAYAYLSSQTQAAFPDRFHVANEPNRSGLHTLPGVNRDMFVWNESFTFYTMIPWLICSAKRAERVQEEKALFRCVCEWSTGGRQGIQEPDLYPIPVPGSINPGYPFLIENIWGEEQKELFEQPDTGGSTVDFRLPTGNVYPEPFLRRYPNRSIRQHQFEVILEDINNVIESRLFTVNDRAFQGDPAPSPYPEGEPNPPRWMITDIQYQFVNGVIDNAGTLEGVENVALMSYTINRTARDGGWYDRRALVDYYYLQSARDLESITPNIDTTHGFTRPPCKLNRDGTRKDPQSDPFTFQNYAEQPFGNWSFLRQ